jgi:perosamine synthetase
MIPIYKPYLPPNSLKYAHDALNSTWVSSQGEYLQIVVEKLQNLLDIQYIIPLNNGTSACHLAAKALHKAFPSACSKKKIIVPNNVYVAAWNAFLYDNNFCNAIYYNY